ncbi:NAD(P)-dependent alcohol dehydrogenase [Spiractinospora alimapuensis]|uniref:NAD(P)-dependent alcohol dehydrogenase n=1 Tax=Spiractinospora alimapuensis TaxID=2820884 RepID=UPI001F344963|nr:NAD(P)-dependent alcohol dehydrogenase [Spiractinospora alimapuensis]QVQ49992.1 NAD(P)-dependent alcohol dehydrogenase [Spiractinospora alimapuensis]
MRAAVLEDVRRVVLQERSVPQPGPLEVQIKVLAVGVCGSDVHFYEHGRIQDLVVEKPLVLGHEVSGVVTALGSAVSRVDVGQRVALEPGVPDFTCAECRAGRYNLCPRMRFFATPPVDGAFAEYVVLHEAMTYPVPDQLTDDATALLEPLSVGIWASQKARVTTGDRVLVNGAGPIGLLAAQVARVFGASEVVVADVNTERLGVADSLGADTVDVGTTGLAASGFEPTVLLECSGNVPATVAAVRTVARAGRVVLVGMGADEVPLPLSKVQQYELEVTGTFRYANTWPTAIDLAATERVALDPLVTGHYRLDQVEDALTSASHDPSVIKSVVLPPRLSP